ncbi:MFS transporter [Corynebacterium canis]|uniref:MFS transporter n=2 Tax=Corynebacterium canis TaxID=679663 RepID=A0A5C5UEP3_9CORY|nr:MFS transporter [Corynebacterium canis]WJY75421.1 Major Facilitator Superfamily protein [Corynebacterium canis]
MSFAFLGRNSKLRGNVEFLHAGMAKEDTALVVFVRKSTRFAPGEFALYSAMLLDAIGLGSYLSTSFLYFVTVWAIDGRDSGMILAAVGIVSLVCLAPGGKLADTFGPRRALWVTSGIRGVGFLLMTLAPNFTIGVVGGLIAGIVGRVAGPIAQSVVLTFSDAPERSTMLLANYRMLRNLGFGIGGMIAGITIGVGTPEAYRLLYFLSAGLFFIGLLILVLWLPKHSRDSAKAGEKKRDSGVKSRLPTQLVLLTVMNGALSLHTFIFTIIAPYWLAQQSLIPPWTASIVMVFNTFLVVILQRPLSRGTEVWRRASTYTMFSTLVIASGCVLPILAVQTARPLLATVLFLAGIILITVGAVLQTSGIYGMILPYVDGPEKTYRMAFFGFGFSVATIVGPVISGYVAPAGDIGWLYIAVYFLVVAFLIAIAVRWLRADVNFREEKVVDNS